MHQTQACGRTRNESASVTSISVGDSVALQGTVSGSNVDATKIYAVTIPQSANNGSIRGTVTAVSGDTITILATGGTTYTVDTSDADFKGHKNNDEDISDIDVGETIVVQGDVDGDSIDASLVSEAELKAGWLQRFGNFWKHLFGKKSSNN